MKLSLITATYNSSKTIAETIDSVLSQNIPIDIEWIIQDNCSTDDTLSIIENKLPHLKEKGIKICMHCEKDKGIADAWNKGITKSTGELIGILNSDDTYAVDTLSKVMASSEKKDFDILYGVCIRTFKTTSTSKVIARRHFPLFYWWNFGFSHTTCFVKKELYSKIGLFDTDFKIAFDYDFLIRALKNNATFARGNHVVYMKDGGVSTRNISLAQEEKNNVLLKNGCPKIIIKIINSFYETYRKVRFRNASN